VFEAGSGAKWKTGGRKPRSSLRGAVVGSLPAALGLPLGEAFHCAHAAQSPEGCSATEFYRNCGSRRAAIDRPGDDATSAKWHIVRSAAGAEETDDLTVTASPIEGQRGFAGCTLTDFRHEKWGDR
jgi:hypothetical protein